MSRVGFKLTIPVFERLKREPRGPCDRRTDPYLKYMNLSNKSTLFMKNRKDNSEKCQVQNSELFFYELKTLNWFGRAQTSVHWPLSRTTTYAITVRSKSKLLHRFTGYYLSRTIRHHAPTGYIISFRYCSEGGPVFTSATWPNLFLQTGRDRAAINIWSMRWIAFL
jgi:hypothetical protein